MTPNHQQLPPFARLPLRKIAATSSADCPIRENAGAQTLLYLRRFSQDKMASRTAPLNHRQSPLRGENSRTNTRYLPKTAEILIIFSSFSRILPIFPAGTIDSPIKKRIVSAFESSRGAARLKPRAKIHLPLWVGGNHKFLRRSD